MLGIGDFAKFGSVSVRMLRHYDAVGLLRPVRVDEFTGYRYYAAAQLTRLNRIIALKELGFSLQQVAEMLDERVSVAELRGMLRLRRTELAAALAADAARLTQVEARLRTIESEGVMSADEVVLKRVPTVRVAELAAEAQELLPEHITPVIGPLIDRLCQALDDAGVRPVGPCVAHYEPLGEGEASPVMVHASLPVDVEPDSGFGFDVVELPELPSAATIVHRGSMDNVMATLQKLAHWIEANGYRSTGTAREVTLSVEGGPDHWVTELQEPVEAINAG